MSRKTLVLAFALPVACLAAPLGIADGPKSGKKAAAPTRAEVVVRALRRLDEDCATTARDMNEQHRIFTLSIASLCFLLDPTGAKGTVHADRLDKALDAIGRYVDGAAAAFARTAPKGDDARSAFEWSQTTWSLGAAGILYAELQARGLRKGEAGKRLRRVADLLARHQQPDGGFGHDQEGRPRIPEIQMPDGTKMKYPATLISASNWACMALGLARPLAGKKLDAVVAKAKGYYAASASTTGTYPYDPTQKGSSFDGDVTQAARTAGSYAALRALGVPPRDKSLGRTASFLERKAGDLPEGHGSSPHGVFFGAIATLEIGGKARAEFEKSVLPRIEAALDPETGALDCICRHEGGTTCESFRNGENVAMKMMGGDLVVWCRAYVTALNLFALLAEKGKLKLLDGIPADAGGPGAATTPDETPAGHAPPGEAPPASDPPAPDRPPPPDGPQVK